MLIITRYLFIGSIVTFLALFQNGCQRQQKRTNNTNKVTIALGAAPSTLDPTKATDATGMRMVSLLYQGLVQVGADLKPTADLAKKWTVDNKRITFYILSSTKFSDGTPLKCIDLKNSITTFQGDKCPFKSVFTKIKNIDCVSPEKNFELSFDVEADIDKFLLADLPVLKVKRGSLGTGPYTLDSIDPSKAYLKRNPEFEQPQKYDLVFYFLKDDFSRFLKVYKGDIDIAPNSIPFEKISSFEDTAFTVVEKPSLSTSYLLVNFKNPALQNIELRKKIYNDLNIPDLVQNRFENHVTRARSLLSPEHPYYSKKLDQIGHKTSGEKITPPLLTLKTSNARQARETGKIIAQTLRAKGSPTVLQSFEWGTYYKDVKSGKFDLALMQWVGVVDPDLYNLAFHSSEFPPGRNRGYYKNDDLDKLLESGQSSPSTADRKTVYNNVQNHVFENLAILPLWHENQVHILHPRVKNYKLNPMGSFSSLLNLEIQKQGL